MQVGPEAQTIRGSDWSDADNDRAVADYFAMLAEELAGGRPNKAEHNRRLQALIARSKGSIEFKHQNISAVLKGMGETWIEGYKPAVNFQRSLEDAVARWLDQNPDWLVRAPSRVRAAGQFTAEQDILWIGPPPTSANTPPPPEMEAMERIAARFDAALRDERNRALGRAGEEIVFHHERATLSTAGRHDLARRVIWTSRDEGDGAGYDIASFELDGKPRLIEVKTTNGWERTPFHISRNELAVANDRHREWCLLRLWNFSREPRAFEIRPPLEAHVTLTPTSFMAAWR